ncbi:mannose-6-phosphate isomerase, class I [Corynebacterium urinipleomorphum]|uniref:mannose-6-phosphate isomerase, class I n=1 Tax=Corynebacterium urinipleomorphum TaxID=1852380 RepID=UPI000B35AAB9|nr:mannose-6-phosphate isomerase, class I [Corynebacterium urinipleomorphum]
MELLTPALQTYPWGSRTLLAQLRGEDSPAASPQAELWFGAHPAAPATVGEVGLDDVIADDPVDALGPAVRGEFGDSLPFLLKILAADSPLSIQAHPTAAQARAGFEAENAAGIPLDAPQRNYKDPNHKPELLVALTPFRALAGLRAVERTLALFDHLDCPELSRYSAMLHTADQEEGLRALFTTWISLPRVKRVEVIEGVRGCVDKRSFAHAPLWMREAVRCFDQLAHAYPGDVGVLASLLLNYIELAPGEALYLGAGRLHAYVEGMAVEIMANSDNVLRGGLTTKHVDVPELVRITDFTPLDDPRVGDSAAGGAHDFDVPVRDFRLTRYELAPGDGFDVATSGPAIVLCTGGTANCGPLELTPGSAAWIPASDPDARVTARGNENAEVFYARVTR